MNKQEIIDEAVSSLQKDINAVSERFQQKMQAAMGEESYELHGYSIITSFRRSGDGSPYYKLHEFHSDCTEEVDEMIDEAVNNCSED